MKKAPEEPHPLRQGSKEETESKRDVVFIKDLKEGEILCPTGGKYAKTKGSSLKRKPTYSKVSVLNDDGINTTLVHERKLKRKVSFASLTIRPYDVTLGDHPSCRRGPPLALSWNYSPEIKQEIEQYEAARESRRSGKQLEIDYKIRVQFLKKEAGYTSQELMEVMNEILKIKIGRTKTANRASYSSKAEEALESIMRRLKPRRYISPKKNRSVAILCS